jgi:hypothetical protein
MWTLSHILITFVLISPFENCIGEEKPVPIACGPFAFPVSPTYPYIVYSTNHNGKQGARLIERPLNNALPSVELILGCTGTAALEQTKSKEPKQPNKERQLNVAETSALLTRLLLSLEKHHGAQLLNKLKSNMDDNKDLMWVLDRDDSNDLLATSIIIDAIITMERGKKEAQVQERSATE